MKCNFEKIACPAKGMVVVLVPEAAASAAIDFYDGLSGGAVKKALEDQRFTGKAGQSVSLLRPHADLQRLVIAGIGKPGEWTGLKALRCGGDISGQIAEGADTVILILDHMDGLTVDTADLAAHLAAGVLLRAYKFDKYRTKKSAKAEEPKEAPIRLENVIIQCVDPAQAQKQFAAHEAVAKGVFFARDLVSEPANVLHPESYTQRLLPLKELGLDVDIFTEAQLEKMGFHLMLSVGRGSARESRLGVMVWNGAGDDSAPLAFVGKGITFDTGGISIKPSAGMADMKWDMAGSAAVVGTMIALASRKARVNAVGVVALAENMPSGEATRPGDIVTSLSGQTVENLNTDAEGRLVLADAVWYTEERFKPAALVDLATLTGAILVALGEEYAGLFASDDELAGRLEEASKITGEKVWRMPLDDAYNKELDSDIADMKNIGNGRNAGSALGAHFIQRFIRNVPWAHLDIAGMAWAGKAKDITPKGATAWGVRLLDQLARSYERG